LDLPDLDLLHFLDFACTLLLNLLSPAFPSFEPDLLLPLPDFPASVVPEFDPEFPTTSPVLSTPLVSSISFETECPPVLDLSLDFPLDLSFDFPLDFPLDFPFDFSSSMDLLMDTIRHFSCVSPSVLK